MNILHTSLPLHKHQDVYTIVCMYIHYKVHCNKENCHPHPVLHDQLGKYKHLLCNLQLSYLSHNYVYKYVYVSRWAEHMSPNLYIQLAKVNKLWSTNFKQCLSFHYLLATDCLVCRHARLVSLEYAAQVSHKLSNCSSHSG